MASSLNKDRNCVTLKFKDPVLAHQYSEYLIASSFWCTRSCRNFAMGFFNLIIILRAACAVYDVVYNIHVGLSQGNTLALLVAPLAFLLGFAQSWILTLIVSVVSFGCQICALSEEEETDWLIEYVMWYVIATGILYWLESRRMDVFLLQQRVAFLEAQSAPAQALETIPELQVTVGMLDTKLEELRSTNLCREIVCRDVDDQAQKEQIELVTQEAVESPDCKRDMIVGALDGEGLRALLRAMRVLLLCLKKRLEVGDAGHETLLVVEQVNDFRESCLEAHWFSTQMLSNPSQQPELQSVSLRCVVLEAILVLKLGVENSPRTTWSVDGSITEDLVHTKSSFLRLNLILMLLASCKFLPADVQLHVDLQKEGTMVQFTVTGNGCIRFGRHCTPLDQSLNGWPLIKMLSEAFGGECGLSSPTANSTAMWFRIPFIPVLLPRDDAVLPDPKMLCLERFLLEQVHTDTPCCDTLNTSLIPAAAEGEADSSRLDILLIEDNSAVSMLECMWLRTLNLNVHTAIDCASASQQLRARRYALVLCDIAMPGHSSGLAVVKEFRKWEAIHRRGEPIQQISVLSAYSMITNNLDLDLKISNVLEKPLDLDRVSGLLPSSSEFTGLLALPTGILIKIVQYADPVPGYSANMCTSVCVRFSWLIESIQHESQMVQTTNSVGCTNTRHYVRQPLLQFTPEARTNLTMEACPSLGDHQKNAKPRHLARRRQGVFISPQQIEELQAELQS